MKREALCLQFTIGIAWWLTLSACAHQPHIVHPVTAVAGPINGETVLKYDTVAVFKFNDAPGVPGSGDTAAGLLTNLLTKMGFIVVERTRLDQIVQEQITLSSGGQRNPISIGKFAGAKAVAVGELGQWETHRRKTDTTYMAYQGVVVPNQGQQWDETYVSLSFRIIDVDDGTVVFSADGHLPAPVRDPPQRVAQLLFQDILRKMASQLKTAPAYPGVLGFQAQPQSTPEGYIPVVKLVIPESPAAQAEIQVGDMVISCDGQSTRGANLLNTKALFLKLCRRNPEKQVLLDLLRGTERLQISVKAIDRSRLRIPQTEGTTSGQ